MDRKVGFCLLGIAALVLAGECLLYVGRQDSGSRTADESGAEQMHSSENDGYTSQLFAMDTYMEFAAYGDSAEEAVLAAMEEVKRLDGLWSTGDADSEVSRLNQEGSLFVSEDTAELFHKADELYQETGGLFDITIYPLMQLWGFPTQEYHVATEEELASVLPLIDASQITVESSDGSGETVRLGDGQKVDFGGIAKGYTSARIMEIFESYGVTTGMVSLGGNVQVLHTKPDGSSWKIGIRDPEGSQTDSIGVLSVTDRAVITSGGYERYFSEAGKTYIHILDPRTGCPAEGDLLSVSIISGDGSLADALSTSLYIMGLDGACDFWRSHKEDFDMVLITRDKEVYISAGIADQWQSEKEVIIVE